MFKIFRGSAKQDEVDATSVQYDEMALTWELPDTLWGGTAAMRDKPEYLPKFKGEKNVAFVERLNQSFLFNQFKNTIEDVTAKPFAEEVIVTDAPEALDKFEEDVDGKGTSLTQFAKDTYEEAQRWGLTHILVDMPPLKVVVDDNGDEVERTFEDQLESGRRPVWSHVPPHALINWDYETVGGQTVLTEIMILEFAVQRQEGKDYLNEIVEYIRIVRRETWELYKKNAKGKWDLADNGPNDLGKVPLETYYVRPTGFMTGDPTHMDLAWLNLEHYQSKSDQRNILHYSRFAQLFAKGMTAKEIKDSHLVGANRLFAIKNTDGDMKYVEIQGAGIAAGEKDITKIEEEMEVLKAAPFVQRKGFDAKATGMIINEARSTSPVKAWANILSKSLKNAYRLTAEWIGTELPETFQAKVYTDFVNQVQGGKDMDQITKMREDGVITKTLELKEAQRRGIVMETVDPEDEIKDANAENMDDLKRAVDAAKQGSEGDEFDDGDGEGNEE